MLVKQASNILRAALLCATLMVFTNSANATNGEIVWSGQIYVTEVTFYICVQQYICTVAGWVPFSDPQWS